MLFCLILGTACSEDPIVENPSGETFIYSLNITNAGLTGTEVVQGTLNEEAKTVDFTIAAESDIYAIKFGGKLSLGAKLDQETYDVSSGSAQVTVVNVENTCAYTVNVTLLEPVAKPLVQKVTLRDASGVEKAAFVSDLDKTIYMKSPESEWVEIVSIESLPKRSVATWTAMTEDGKIYASNPGQVIMDFEGIKAEYRVLFDANPVFGADFNAVSVYDFSGRTTSYPDFTGEMVRSTDFDGNSMLIVSRSGGTFPKVMKYLDIKTGAPVETVLDVTGIAGGTHLISAGRLSHGHIYICNLTTSVGADQPLKVYHWASNEAGVAPDVVVDFVGEGVTKLDVAEGEEPIVTWAGRLGDNMSINLDENGNGYAFFLPQEGATLALRYTVTNFTEFSEPTMLTLEVGGDYYASINKVAGSDDEYVYTSTKAPIVIIDHNGKTKLTLGAEAVPLRATDARIITYDAERYLIMTTGRAKWAADPVSAFYVYNISEGSNTMLALKNFDELEERIPVFSYELAGTGGSAHSANTGFGISDEGNLLLMSSATVTGFSIFEFPEKQ